MRIIGSSDMSRDALWRVSGPALEWRKRLSLRPGTGHVAAVPEPDEVGESRASRAGRAVQARSLREWSSTPGGVGEVKVQHVRGPGA